MIDLNLIERGADYRELKKSYIIFICPVDVFRFGLHKYTFENRCAEIPDLLLGDEVVKIFLCAGGTADDVSDDMSAFLEYISGKKNNNRFVQELDAEVQKARNREEWRMEYMTLLMRDQEMISKGREEGRELEIFSSVQEGDYDVSRGAEKLGISEVEFEKRMEKAGYKIPEKI